MPIDKVRITVYTCHNLQEREADSDMNHIFWRLLRANFRNGRMCSDFSSKKSWQKNF